MMGKPHTQIVLLFRLLDVIIHYALEEPLREYLLYLVFSWLPCGKG